MPRTKTTKVIVDKTSYLDKVEQEVEANQSKISLILGGLIVVVAAFLLFNYFNKGKAEVTPEASQTDNIQQQVTPENKTPEAAAATGEKYTVKEGDTLFMISTQVYKDGYKFTEIAKANNIQDPNLITVGQKLDLPKLEVAAVAPTNTPSAAVVPTTPPTQIDTAALGPKITTATYVVVEGDWLSTISGRAYGDPMSYKKIAEANKITNPDVIIPGMTLIIPR